MRFYVFTSYAIWKIPKQMIKSTNEICLSDIRSLNIKMVKKAGFEDKCFSRLPKCLYQNSPDSSIMTGSSEKVFVCHMDDFEDMLIEWKNIINNNKG